MDILDLPEMNRRMSFFYLFYSHAFLNAHGTMKLTLFSTTLKSILLPHTHTHTHTHTITNKV